MIPLNLFAKLKKFLKVSVITYVAVIIAVNGLFYLCVGFGMGETLYNDGIIILGPSDHAYLFVHGAQEIILPENETPCLLNISFEGKNMTYLEFQNLWFDYKVRHWNYSIINNSVIIKNHSLIYNWSCIHNLSAKAHFTGYSNRSISTLELINQLHDQGYNQIWGTWCHSGDEDYIIKYPNGTEIPWPNNVTRKTKPGITIPLFIGYKFILV